MARRRVAVVVLVAGLEFLVIGHEEAVVIVLGVVPQQADVVQGSGHGGRRRHCVRWGDGIVLFDAQILGRVHIVR